MMSIRSPGLPPENRSSKIGENIKSSRAVKVHRCAFEQLQRGDVYGEDIISFGELWKG